MTRWKNDGVGGGECRQREGLLQLNWLSRISIKLKNRGKGFWDEYRRTILTASNFEKLVWMKTIKWDIKLGMKIIQNKIIILMIIEESGWALKDLANEAVCGG